MRIIYTILLYLLVPWLIVRLLIKSLRFAKYRERMPERFGIYRHQFDQSIWVHAVSAGEVAAAAPLIRKLCLKYPEYSCVVSTGTPTGALRVQTEFNRSVQHLYLPYDLPDAMNRFLTAVKPKVAILIETELWPNLLHACEQRKIPVYILNARLSERSARGYRWIAQFMRRALRAVTQVVAVSPQDATRFQTLGVDARLISVSGNLKFDVAPIIFMRSRMCTLFRRLQAGMRRFIWIAASTHDGEEKMILQAHQIIGQKFPHALLILVPRHPDRFNAVYKLAARNFVTLRRSVDLATPYSPSDYAQAQIYLGDTMGELGLLYAVAHVVFVGGSLIPQGGHNMIEPAQIGKPMLSGKYLFNFVQVSQLFCENQALQLVDNALELASAVNTLFLDRTQRKYLARNALAVVKANRGALAIQLAAVKI